MLMLSKKRFILILCIFFNPAAAFAEESITITTYYPSPSGSYNQVRVSRSVIYNPVDKDKLSDPQKGEVIYNDKEDRFYYYNGSSWIAQSQWVRVPPYSSCVGETCRPSVICAKAGYTAFSGACRWVTDSGSLQEGSLIASNDNPVKDNKSWHIYCSLLGVGRNLFGINNSAEILCIK